MPESRRDFLVKCLGGAVIPLTAASLVPVVVAATPAPLPIEATPAQAIPTTGQAHGYRPVHNVSIATDFYPDGTRFYYEGDRTLGLVTELLLQRYENGACWIGLELLLPCHRIHEFPVMSVAGREGHIEVELRVDGKTPLNMSVLQLTTGVGHANVPSAFLAALVPDGSAVRFTRALADLDISFMRCANCGKYDRCLHFSAKDHDWALADLNTAERPCPRCGCAERQRLNFHDLNLLRKLYMTPTTSHLVFSRHPDDSFERRSPLMLEEPSIYPAGFNVMNRPAWLASECNCDAAVAQITPKPSFLYDVFLESFGQMFRCV